MIWLLAAQVVVMLPFLFDLPLWLLPVLLLAAGWRLRVLSGAALQLGNAVKVLLIGLGVGGLLVVSLPR